MSDTTAATDAPLTGRQEQILTVITEYVEEHGYAPSVREIGDAVGLSSPSSVHSHLRTLEERGYLRRHEDRPRAMEVERLVDEPFDRAERGRSVPLVGEIAAGAPIVAEERIDTVWDLPHELVGDGEVFMLKVRGDSMIDAGVLDGDFVVIESTPVVSQGDMCAAMIEGEATVKFWRKTRKGEIFLDPANENYEPIPVHDHTDAAVIGRVVSVLRGL